MASQTEPDDYCFDELVRDQTTVWDGVANALALIHIRAMKKGDEAIVYHTGDEKSAIGLATVMSAPYADPAGDNEKLAVVDLKVGKRLASPVSLATIKADPAFAGWDLLRIGRLSVVPVPDAMWSRLLELASKADPLPAAVATSPKNRWITAGRKIGNEKSNDDQSGAEKNGRE